ncbi:3-carboxyethylcatechol 2,3-dioxygenase [Pseudomonas alkylphenolica]|uniref:3-carboxyethylcatechol 2,3-dioxygenase n=1 Tax=Pseudomonas alkylphenolica TaxID=237609 RepID=UPI0018D7AAFC|nr:3-carboxyethylcatechol 2,3-dioxygenase [Pseudomonas alkylphenolica]MBH3430771.1 3-carboxyethylcatechol 2,3-dioxygenase [Pseudomonas alkylphenolica]
MSALVQCLSHTPLVGYVDPAPAVLEEVDSVVARARAQIEAFAPELVILFAPDHYNGFFYDVMPSFCIGMAANAIGDFDTAAGPFDVPKALAEGCADAVLDAGVDAAVSYCMQVDHGFAQPLELLLGGIDRCPVIPVFINSVAVPLPSFRRARLLGEAIGRYAGTLNKRVLFIGSGGLSHQPPVPELAHVDARMADRLMGSGRDLPADEREARQQRVIQAARRFVEDQGSLHPLNPAWDQGFLDTLASGRISDLDSLGNAELSRLAGKSTHEVKTWVAAFAALSAFGPYHACDRYYRPIPEWIAGFGALAARPECSPLKDA